MRFEALVLLAIVVIAAGLAGSSPPPPAVGQAATALGPIASTPDGHCVQHPATRARPSRGG